MFDGEELFGERAASQLSQIGQLSQEALPLLFEVGIDRGGRFHIVVYILQYYSQKQGKPPNPSFISSPPAIRSIDSEALNRNSVAKAALCKANCLSPRFKLLETRRRWMRPGERHIGVCCRCYFFVMSSRMSIGSMFPLPN